MRERFGDEYQTHRRSVPMFLPRLGRWGELLERR